MNLTDPEMGKIIDKMSKISDASNFLLSKEGYSVFKRQSPIWARNQSGIVRDNNDITCRHNDHCNVK